MKKRQNGEAYDRLNQEIENWLNQAVDMDGDSPSSRGGGMDTTAIQTPTGLPSTLPREDDPPTHQDGPLKRAFDAMRECVRDTENDFDPPTTAFPNIDGYEVQSVIGRGGMGVVYAARQSGLNRTVAIKCLNLGLASETRARARFEIEVQAAAKLDHPHIVPIYAVGQVPIYAVGRVPIHALGQVPADDNGPVESSPYYAMQRIDGADAQARINRQGRPETPAEIAGVIEGLSNIADAIDHAHQHGIIHRDLKPANLLIDNDGKWWVVDFGLARIQDHQVTGTGDRLGSLRYMSPEQIRGDAVDHRTDVYSLGITLSECLTGRPVVAGDQTSQIIQSVLETRPPLISTLHPAVSLDTARVIQKSVEKDPSDRYATAADFAADLRAAAHGDPIRARPIGIVGRIQRYARRRPRQIALATVASGLVLAMIASAAIYTADRLSKNNRDLRRQYATVMEMNGRQAILSDTPESAASFYRKAAETSPDAGFIQLQRDRLRWIDQMTASMQRSGSIPGRLLDQVRITPKNPAGDGRSILSTANLISIRSAKSTPTTAQSLRLITTSGQGVGGQPSTSESVADFVQPVLTARLNDSADRIAVVTGDPSDSDRTIHLLHRESTTKPLAGDDGPAFKKVAEFKAGRRVLWLSFEGPSDDLLVTGWSGYLRRHDSQTGRLIQQSPLGPDDESTRVNWVYNARSDRSKTWLALATSPGHVQVYRRSDGSPVFASPPKLPSLYNDALAIDDAGKWLAIGDNAGHLTMFSLQNPERAPRTFKASSPIVDLAIEPKTDRIVVATGDRRVQLVSLQTGRRLTRTFEHPRLIQGLRISPDGQALAVFGGERLRLHSLSTGEPLSSLLRCAPDLIQIRWENRRDPDDAIPLGQRDIVRGVSGGLNRLRTLHRDQASNQTIQQSWRLPIWKENVVRLPDATRPLHLQAIRGSDQTSVSIIVHAVEKPDSVEPIRLGDDLESDAGGDSYEDRRVVRYRLDRVSNSSLPTEAIRDRPEALKSDAFRSVQYNRSGKSVVHTTTNNGTDKFTLDCRPLQASFQGVSHVHLSDDDRLSIGGFSGQVQIIDPAHPESALKLPHPHWTTVSIPFDRRHWLSGCWDGGVRMWRAQTDAGDLPSGTQQPVGKYDHRSVISDLAVSGDLVFSADWNGRLRCERWSGSRFEAIASQSHDGGKIVGLKAAATNDDHRIASFGDDNTVRLWDGRLNELATIRLANQVQTIAFSSDGSLLAVLQTDGNLSIYTGRKGKLLYPQISAGTGITTASWEGRRLWLGGTSPDGAWVAHLDPP